MNNTLNQHNFIRFAILFIITMLITSCGLYITKDGYIKSFGDFVSNVKDKSSTYTEEDWNKVEIEYNKFAEQDYEKYRNDFTQADREVIGKIKASYTLIKLKKEGNNAIEQVKDMLYQVKGVFNEVTDSIVN